MQCYIAYEYRARSVHAAVRESIIVSPIGYGLHSEKVL